jgi:hypothetical protein
MNLPVVAGLVTALLVAMLILFVYRRRRAGGKLQRVLNDISADRIDGLVLPNADEGEIQIDHLLLTAHGLLVLHIKDVQGIVFGSDKMQEWTVMAEDRRYTFSNPQPALFDRIAAVKQVVKDVPVTGRLLFVDGAEFRKGVPDLVTTIDELHESFSNVKDAESGRKIDSFKPYWDKLKSRAN